MILGKNCKNNGRRAGGKIIEQAQTERPEDEGQYSRR